MCPAHRKERLEYVRRRLKEKKPILAVSTQLIEAGVDVDFGAAIRFLAGLDSIAQAAGRCNRHGRPELGIVRILNAAEEKLGNLVDIRKGCEVSQRLLDDFPENRARYRHQLLGPDALTDYYRYYFFERHGEMSYPITSEDGQDSLLNLLAGNTKATQAYFRERKANPPLHFAQAFMTAGKAFKSIDTPTRGVIVPYGEEGQELIGQLCGAFEVEKQFRLLKRAQQFTVNVFPDVLRQLEEAGVLQRIQPDIDILHLDERHYSEEFGLSIEPVRRMRTQNV